mgnify:CR=1 FL=1
MYWPCVPGFLKPVWYDTLMLLLSATVNTPEILGLICASKFSFLSYRAEPVSFSLSFSNLFDKRRLIYTIRYFCNNNLTATFFRFFDIQKEGKIQDLFAIQIKALTILNGQEFANPTREVRVYVREAGQLVESNRLKGYITERITSASGVDNLIVRFFRIIDGEDHFFNCLFMWSKEDRKYKFVSVERIEGKNWGGPVKESEKAATSQQVYDEPSGRLDLDREVGSQGRVALWQLLVRGGFFPAQRILTAAISAIDIALWDIKGKALGVPKRSVEIVAEGPRLSCERLIETLRSRRAPGHVSQVAVSWNAPTGMRGFRTG